MMELVSVNVGAIRQYNWGKGVRSAIHKTAVDNPLRLTSTGFDEDEQADLGNHGDEDKAVLIIPTDNYAFFEVDKPWGFLGETLSISGLDENQISIGDQFNIGDVQLEVSQPRSPCAKLAEHVAVRNFVKHYSASGRVGFYCRVLKTGSLQAGMDVKYLPTTEKTVAIRSLFIAQYCAKKTATDYQKLAIVLALPSLSTAWRKKLTKMMTLK
jgi:MOSC domain-containing protein YiiM